MSDLVDRLFKRASKELLYKEMGIVYDIDIPTHTLLELAAENINELRAQLTEMEEAYCIACNGFNSAQAQLTLANKEIEKSLSAQRERELALADFARIPANWLEVDWSRSYGRDQRLINLSNIGLLEKFNASQAASLKE